MIKRISWVLWLPVILCLAFPVRADSSTTTYYTASKNLSANTEIFVVTDEPYDDYVCYGALWEPDSGVYFGRTCDAGAISHNTWGTVNGAEQADESITSVYYELTSPYSLEYWSYLFRDLIADGEHALLVNLNFQGQAKDCGPAAAGEYDEKLMRDFQYLSGIEGPLFLRIGGEVNIWDDRPRAGSYIAAFRHIASLVRTYCPNVALVYSPNFTSGFGVDLDSYYPGDEWVDWIGASLYYNQYSLNNDYDRDEFYGVGRYGDAVVNIQQVVNLSRMHKKPIIITEGGSARINRDRDVTDSAAERLERAYTFLTMVYPEIKCLVLSDTNFDEAHEKYSIHDSPVMTAAYNRAVENNPTLIRRYQDNGRYYTRLSAYPLEWEGVMELTAYANADHRPSANWYVDGKWRDNVTSYPYRFYLNVDELTYGYHTVTVEFSHGFSKTYRFLRAIDIGGFHDLIPDSYYIDPVLWAREQGVTAGVKAELFDPDAVCSRAQVVTFLWNAAGKPDPGDVRMPFVDVPKNAYYRDAVLWAVQNGVTSGVDASHFGPDAPCTRAQVATFLWNRGGKEDPGPGYIPFTDVPDGKYYTKAVRWALMTNVTTGVSNTRFGPDQSCTRAQVVTFLWRAAGQPEQHLY